MKPFGFTVSILKDTNRVIASSEIDLSKVKAGDYFRIDNETAFYTIARTDKLFYIKDFEVIDVNNIRLSSPVGINLQPSDNVKLTFKEFQLEVLSDIKNGGQGYRVDDVLTVIGGTPSLNRSNGMLESTSFVVVEVDANGSILSLGPRTKGLYLESPIDIVELSGGFGAGAVVEVNYSVVEHRAALENVVSYTPDINTGVIGLEFKLPTGLKKGKLSVEKWQALLTAPYIGESKINTSYDISSNFTPKYRLPLMLQNSFQREILYNQAMNILEEKIAALEARVAQLEKA